MTKQEFLESLRRSLTSSLDYQAVNEHIRYYTDYIETQIRQGRTEAEVMAELGDPRLIAKTLVGMEDAEAVTEEYVEDEQPHNSNDRYFNFNGKNIRIPGWLFTVLVCLLIFGVLTLIFTLVSALLPYALIIIALIFCYRFIRNIFR